jgi:oxygen-independent coproporphyrinogen-3 oxidase
MPSLYVHIPFCPSKCGYCAFYSVPLNKTLDNQNKGEIFAGNSELISQYLSGVAQEIKLRLREAPSGVSTLFLGGGTPTVLSPKELDELLKTIHTSYKFEPGQAEKTVEANPGTLTGDKLAVLCDYGINRISLGAQSFNNQILKGADRIHTVEDISLGIKIIRKAGIENLSLDLIFGLPGQTLPDWQDTLKQAVAYSPEHLSLYALSLEENTPFGRKYLTLNQNSEKNYANGNNDTPNEEDDGKNSGSRLFLPADDLQADMYEWAQEYLAFKGYKHYEISNFAQEGFECLHNQAYWQGVDYLGLGPGAVSCLRGVRTKNIEDLGRYSKMILSGEKAFDSLETEVLTKEQLITEYMILGLRTADGIDLKKFTGKFKIEVQDIYGQILANYIDREILILSKGRLRINEIYFFVANFILEKFVL